MLYNEIFNNLERWPKQPLYKLEDTGKTGIPLEISPYKKCGRIKLRVLREIEDFIL